MLTGGRRAAPPPTIHPRRLRLSTSAHTRRMTPQRAEILAELQAAHDHPTAAELYERLRPRLPRLSLGTVYRNLDVLAAEGLAAKLAGNGAEARYDGMPAPHDHARCRCCGAVADIPVQGADGMPVQGADGMPAQAAAAMPALPPGFVLESRRLEYLGVCADCRAAGHDTRPPASAGAA